MQLLLPLMPRIVHPAKLYFDPCSSYCCFSKPEYLFILTYIIAYASHLVVTIEAAFPTGGIWRVVCLQPHLVGLIADVSSIMTMNKARRLKANKTGGDGQ
jgi:hypothetical protein